MGELIHIYVQLCISGSRFHCTRLGCEATHTDTYCATRVCTFLLGWLKKSGWAESECMDVRELESA